MQTSMQYGYCPDNILTSINVMQYSLSRNEVELRITSTLLVQTMDYGAFSKMDLTDHGAFEKKWWTSLMTDRGRTVGQIFYLSQGIGKSLFFILFISFAHLFFSSYCKFVKICNLRILIQNVCTYDRFWSCNCPTNQEGPLFFIWFIK